MASRSGRQGHRVTAWSFRVGAYSRAPLVHHPSCGRTAVRPYQDCGKPRMNWPCQGQLNSSSFMPKDLAHSWAFSCMGAALIEAAYWTSPPRPPSLYTSATALLPTEL